MMLKKIKSLFDVNEDELDLEELENTQNDIDMSYQKELNDNNDIVDNFQYEVKAEDISGYTIKELDNQEDLEEVVDETSSNKSKLQALSNTNKHSLYDFEKDIEKAYDKPYHDIEDDILKENEVILVDKKVKNDNDLVDKSNYVRKPIIKPMSGLDKKDKELFKKDDEHKKSQIIKLREMNKTIEIEANNDNYVDDFKLFEENTKRLEDDLFSISSPHKSSLKDTSKFTLVEDSTGEMRLVIDEDE